MKYLLTLLGCATLVSLAHAQAPRQGPRALDTTQRVRLMHEMLDMKDLQQPMTLKEAVGRFYEMFQARGREMPILVHQQSFKAVDPDMPDLYEMQVKFPVYPRQMAFANALKLALAQLPIESTFLVRGGRIDIIAAQETTLDKLARQPVLGNYDDEPVLSIISDVADQTGVSVVVDRRIDDKLNVPVSVTFTNGINARDALRTLCDMSGLKLIELPTSYYVTTLANELQKIAPPRP
jgi:hypothetical protein